MTDAAAYGNVVALGRVRDGRLSRNAVQQQAKDN